MTKTQTEVALRQVARFCEEERLFRRVGRVLVAVSGGPDSVAALLLLLGLRERFGLEVVAAHFDHRLRPGSAEELERVRRLCDERGVPFRSGEGDVRRAAAERGLGLEEAARTMRYQFLGFIAGKERADAIATGHTADDQAETVLLRVLRGTGVRGLRGMLPAGPVPGASAQRLVRPLLCLSRAETAAVCAEAGVQPSIDPTNADLAFRRNRVRHEVLPALRAVAPGVDDALRGLAESARELFAGVEKAALAVQPGVRTAAGSIFAGERAEAFAGLVAEGRTLVVEREAAFHGLRCEVNRTRLRNLSAVVARGRGRVVFGEAEVEVSCGQVRIGPATPAIVFEAALLNVPGVTMAGPWRVGVAMDGMPAREEARDATVDLREVRGALRVRPSAVGDRIRLGGHEKKLSDALPGLGVPAWERRRLPVIADATRVLAVPGFRLGPEPPEEHALHVRLTLREAGRQV